MRLLIREYFRRTGSDSEFENINDSILLRYPRPKMVIIEKQKRLHDDLVVIGPTSL